MQGGSGSAGNFTRVDSDFVSQGTRCAGWLYRPEGVPKPPIVIMAHGFGAERTFGLPAYAKRFLRRGMAAFLFDYRNFGGSDGEPRNLVSNHRHIKDWEAAVAHVRGLPDIDREKIALWGSSYSGGHVIVTAANDPDIAAIVSQVPFVDGLTTVLQVSPVHVMKAVVAGLRDVASMVTGGEPYCVPVVGDPDTFALMNTPDAYPGFMAILPEDSDWKNQCPARISLELTFYRPVAHARRVRCPALVILAEKDSLIYPKSVEKTASRMREVTLIHMDVGHFDVYVGDVFEKVAKIEADFLARHLLT